LQGVISAIALTYYAGFLTPRISSEAPFGTGEEQEIYRVELDCTCCTRSSGIYLGRAENTRAWSRLRAQPPVLPSIFNLVPVTLTQASPNALVLACGEVVTKYYGLVSRHVFRYLRTLYHAPF
jgi:hypothetical protein